MPFLFMLQSPPTVRLISLTVSEGEARIRRLGLALCQPNKPIRHADYPRHLLPVPALLRMLNGVRHDPALLVKLKDEEAGKLLVVAHVAAQELGDLVDLVAAARDAAVQRAHAAALRLATRLPPHNELLVAEVESRGAVLDDALGEDDEADVADNGYPTPCHRGSPQRGEVGNSAGYSGQMGMCRGEEMECDLWREDLLWKWGRE